MKAFLCELLFSCVLAASPAKPIDELTYGTLLYAYYQQDYQQALLDGLVAEAQGREGDDAIRFELARGSFAFADGMYDYARETFDSVDPGELTQLDQMRLAFHLGREYYRRQQWAELGEQLDRIDLGETWFGRSRLHPEVEFMRAELAVHNGRYAEAETALMRLEPDSPLRAYGLFNLGVALREREDLSAARRVFTELSQTSLAKQPDPEIADLKQRAKLALSFVVRAQRAPQDAEAVLGALPAETRYRDIALASYGSLAMETDDYELAARIWMTLQNQDYWTSSTAQARLGFPASLERLASTDMALLQYQAAERSFENRLAVLTDLSAEVDDPAWVRGLLYVFSSPDRDQRRMNQIMERWQEQLGHTDWIEWLATEETHELLTEWRELVTMQEWLDLLPPKLEAFEEVAAERRRRTAQARRLLHDEELLQQRDLLARQIGMAEAELLSLRQAIPTQDADWMLSLADASQRELIERLGGMERLVRAGMKPAEQSRWLERIGRLRGVLFWQLVDASAGRLREFERALQQNSQLLADLDSRIVEVQTAETEFSAGVETDFLIFSDRARDLMAQVDQARESRELALAAELKRGMQREMREVREYLLVTRIAIARATDQLAMSSVEGDD